MRQVSTRRLEAELSSPRPERLVQRSEMLRRDDYESAAGLKASRFFATNSWTLRGRHPVSCSISSFVPPVIPFWQSMAIAPMCCVKNERSMPVSSEGSPGTHRLQLESIG